MRDIVLGTTFYHLFSTRAFATGIPTVLAGTPVVSIIEDNSATPITAGITLGVDHASVVGLNLLTIVPTGGNGFETLKDYTMYISTGTVDSVSVVGEVVGEFSIDKSAAAVDLANATDGLTALRTLLLDIPTVAEFDARTLIAASYFDPAADTVVTVTNLTNLPSIPANWLTEAGINAAAFTAAKFAAGAIDANALATDAVNEISRAIGIQQNAAFSNFQFLMVLTSDHVTPATGLTVTGERSLDAGAFAAVAGTITEVSDGYYQFDALAADTNGVTVAWKFSSATADDSGISFKTVA